MTGQVKLALANVNNYIVRDDQVQTGPGGDSATNWTDPSACANRGPRR